MVKPITIFPAIRQNAQFKSDIAQYSDENYKNQLSFLKIKHEYEACAILFLCKYSLVFPKAHSFS